MTFRHEKLKGDERTAGGAPLHRGAQAQRADAGQARRRRHRRAGRPLQRAGARAAAARAWPTPSARADIPLLVLNVDLPAGARRDRRLLRRQARGAGGGRRAARVHRAGDRHAAAPARHPDAAARQGPAAGRRASTASRCWPPACSSSRRATCRTHAQDSAQGWLDGNRDAPRGRRAAQLGAAAARAPAELLHRLPGAPGVRGAQARAAGRRPGAHRGRHRLPRLRPPSSRSRSGHSILGYGMSLASRAGVVADDAAARAVDHGRRRLLAQRPAHRRAVARSSTATTRCC